MKKTFLSTIFALCTLFVFAQKKAETPKKREIGLTGLNFSGGSFVMKKELKENIYRRFSVGSANFFFQKGQTLKNTGVRLNTSWGKEKRKNLVPKLELTHGFQYGINGRFDNNKNTQNVSFDFIDTRIGFGAEFGYLIGFIYHLSDKIYIGVESIPNVDVGFNYTKDNSKKVALSFDSVSLNSSGYFQLTAVYKL